MLECKQQQRGGGDDIVWYLQMKSSTSAEHCPSTLTAFEHQASIIQTHDPPLSVLLESCAQNTVHSMRAADECILHILTETGLLWCGRAIWWIIVPLTVVNTRCVVYNSRSHTLNLYVCRSVRVSVCVFVSMCIKILHKNSLIDW